MLAYHATGHQALGSMALEFFPAVASSSITPQVSSIRLHRADCAMFALDPPKTMALPTWFRPLRLVRA